MFNWTAKRRKRLAEAVRAFNAAITRAEKGFIQDGRAELIAYLPRRVTIEGVKSRIANVNDFRRIVGYRSDLKRGRSSELTRILKKFDPGALKVVETKHGRMTGYAKRQMRYNRAAVARRSRKLEKDMARKLFEGDSAVDMGALSPAARLAIVADTEMDPGEGERDESYNAAIDPDTLQRWREEDAQNQRDTGTVDAIADQYLATWEDPSNMHYAMPGYQDMIDAIEWMRENAPNALNKMFVSGRDEVDPMYITASGGIYNPYWNIDYDTRHARAVRYVTGYARKAGFDAE